jgi:hypothetical protein
LTHKIQHGKDLVLPLDNKKALIYFLSETDSFINKVSALIPGKGVSGVGVGTVSPMVISFFLAGKDGWNVKQTTAGIRKQKDIPFSLRLFNNRNYTLPWQMR